MTILDQTSDLSGIETARVMQAYRAPGYVKQASVSTAPENAADSRLYADSVQRKFPVHTKAATWLSNAFWCEKRANVQPADRQRIQTALLKAADFYGIRAEVDSLYKQAEVDNDENKLPDDAFAFLGEDASGNRTRHMPMRTALETKTAAAFFVEHRDRFTFPQQQKVAVRILDKAASQGAGLTNEVDQILSRCAGFGMCAASRTAEFVEKRAAMIKYSDGKLSQQLIDTAQAIRNNPEHARQPAILVKLAEQLDVLDRRFQFNKRYHQDIERPADVLFEVNEFSVKQAAADHIQMTSGSVYRISDLNHVKLADVRDYLGTDLADALTDDGMTVSLEKAATILPTLPRGDAETFDRVVESVIRPVTKMAAARAGLSRTEMWDLAMQASGNR
jgi:hypothetical protein